MNLAVLQILCIVWCWQNIKSRGGSRILLGKGCTTKKWHNKEYGYKEEGFWLGNNIMWSAENTYQTIPQTSVPNRYFHGLWTLQRLIFQPCLMFYFDTNKPQSAFFCKIPVVLESCRSSQGGGCTPRTLHPSPRSTLEERRGIRIHNPTHFFVPLVTVTCFPSHPYLQAHAICCTCILTTGA